MDLSEEKPTKSLFSAIHELPQILGKISTFRDYGNAPYFVMCRFINTSVLLPILYAIQSKCKDSYGEKN